jgi:hypothetical protein
VTIVRTSEITNETAFTANTQVGPALATMSPPISGPTAMPAWTPTVMRLFAHAMSSSRSTRFGIAARDAEKNGSSLIAEPNASTIRSSGSSTKTIAMKNADANASDAIITLRRSNRSPSAPANGPRIPATPNVSNSDSACIPGEWVRSQIVKFSAV